MSLVFEYYPAKGSLKDRYLGTVPTSSNVTGVNTEIGRATRHNGSSSKVKYDYTDFRSSDSAGTIVAWVRSTQATNGGIFSSADTNAFTYFMLWWNAGNIRLLGYDAGVVVKNQQTGSDIKDGAWHCIVAKCDGATSYVKIDNVNQALGATGPEIWFDDISLRDNVTIGYQHFSSVEQAYFDGDIGLVQVYDHTFTAAEDTTAYNDFLAAKSRLENVFVRESAAVAADILVSDSGLNWYATGETVASGKQLTIDIYVASGSFRVKEDSTGKYIECVTNGTIQYKGIDLSSPTGNGYISYIGGDLSGDQDGTVSAASAVAWASNIITITMTANQKLRPPFQIIRGS